MNLVRTVVTSLAVGAVAFVLGYLLRRWTADTKIRKMREDAQEKLSQAKTRLQEA